MEDVRPIFDRLQSHVQMRVSAAFTGTCHGAVFGPPLLCALSLPGAPVACDDSAGLSGSQRRRLGQAERLATETGRRP